MNNKHSREVYNVTYFYKDNKISKNAFSDVSRSYLDAKVSISRLRNVLIILQECRNAIVSADLNQRHIKTE